MGHLEHDLSKLRPLVTAAAEWIEGSRNMVERSRRTAIASRVTRWAILPSGVRNPGF